MTCSTLSVQQTKGWPISRVFCEMWETRTSTYPSRKPPFSWKRGPPFVIPTGCQFCWRDKSQYSNGSSRWDSLRYQENMCSMETRHRKQEIQVGQKSQTLSGAYPDLLPRGAYNDHGCGFPQREPENFSTSSNSTRASGGRDRGIRVLPCPENICAMHPPHIFHIMKCKFCYLTFQLTNL
jgi:hypothetical protein